MSYEASNADLRNVSDETDGPAMDLPDDSEGKIKALKEVFILYPNATRIMEKLDRLMRYGNLGAEVGSPARCFLLTGESGSGKTALLKRWASKYDDDHSGLKDRRPVLYVEVPKNCSPKALVEQMLRDLGMPGELAQRGRTEVSLTARVIHHLREQQVRVVLLDEFQHFINSDNDRVIYKAADTVKHLLNAGTSSFVLSGKPDAAIVYDTNEQLKRRSAGRRHLRAFDWNDQEDRDYFQRALHEYERHLPFEKKFGFARNQAVALRLHHFAAGLLGRVVDLLVEASILALEENAPCIDYDILRRTVEEFRDEKDPDWLNPFDSTALEPLATSKLEATPDRVTRLHKRGRRTKRAELIDAWKA